MSSIYADLPKHPPMSRIWKGVFANSPATEQVLAEVIIPALSKHLRFGGCYWTPRYTIEVPAASVNVGGGAESDQYITVPQRILPKRGNLCLCVFDNDRQIWITEYWPWITVKISASDPTPMVTG